MSFRPGVKRIVPQLIPDEDIQYNGPVECKLCEQGVPFDDYHQMVHFVTNYDARALLKYPFYTIT